MTQSIMTKFKIEVIEYDPTGYYYPKYKTIQSVIAKTVEEAKEIAIERTPWRHSFGGGWEQRATIVTSEDIVIEVIEENT